MPANAGLATPRNCWKMADEKIKYFSEQIAAGIRGDDKVDIQRCHDNIDAWLDYRFKHTATDVDSVTEAQVT